MSQSRLGSFLESLANIAIGYWVAVGAQLVVFPWFGIKVSVQDNLTIGLAFTQVSLARSYLLRRLFNFFHRK